MFFPVCIFHLSRAWGTRSNPCPEGVVPLQGVLWAESWHDMESTGILGEGEPSAVVAGELSASDLLPERGESAAAWQGEELSCLLSWAQIRSASSCPPCLETLQPSCPPLRQQSQHPAMRQQGRVSDVFVAPGPCGAAGEAAGDEIPSCLPWDGSAATCMWQNAFPAASQKRSSDPLTSLSPRTIKPP